MVQWFEEWHNEYKEASVDMAEIERKLMGVENKMDKLAEVLECKLVLLGSSAIEDKLQVSREPRAKKTKTHPHKL